MTQEYELCVSSSFRNLGQIAEFVAERARQAGLDDAQVFDVQMAVDEACTNSMEHAYGGREDGLVRVCCYVEGEDFVVRVTDYGASFDPSAVPKPDLAAPLEKRATGGLGLFFMRELMDQVDFRAHPTEGNTVIMRKRRKRRSP